MRGAGFEPIILTSLDTMSSFIVGAKSGQRSPRRSGGWSLAFRERRVGDNADTVWRNIINPPPFQRLAWDRYWRKHRC